MSKALSRGKLKNSVVAIIRCTDRELAGKIARTAIQSGIKAIEITFTIENAAQLISELTKEFPRAMIGAGTVLEITQAEAAVAGGAEFIVTPCILEDIGRFCRERDVFCSMAATTANEVYHAYRLGSDVVKLFPGEFLSPALIKSLKGPFPFIDFMPTGGIDESNIKDWFAKGAFAVGAGGYLSRGINEDNLDILKERCGKLLGALGEGTGKA